MRPAQATHLCPVSKRADGAVVPYRYWNVPFRYGVPFRYWNDPFRNGTFPFRNGSSITIWVTTDLLLLKQVHLLKYEAQLMFCHPFTEHLPIRRWRRTKKNDISQLLIEESMESCPAMPSTPAARCRLYRAAHSSWPCASRVTPFDYQEHIARERHLWAGDLVSRAAMGGAQAPSQCGFKAVRPSSASHRRSVGMKYNCADLI